MARTTLAICQGCAQICRVKAEAVKDRVPVCGRCSKDLPLHSLVCEVSEQSLMKLLQKAEIPVIADFWASWCGPCRSYSPIFEEASLAMVGEAVFVKVDTEENQAYATRANITGIPTTIVFYKGQEVARKSGALSIPMIRQLIDSVVRA